MATSDALTDAEMGIAAPGGADDALTDEQMNGEGPSGPSRSEAFVRGVGQGVTLGFRDEIAGALQTLLDKLRGGDDPGYEARRDEARQADAAAKQAHSGYFGAGKFVGDVGTLAIPGVAEGGVLAQAGKMALLGGASGVGEAEKAEDIPAEALKGAAAGGVAGGAGALAGRAVGAAAKRLAPGLQSVADAATVRAAGDIGVDTGKMTAEQVSKKAEFLRQGKFVEPFDTVGHVSDKLQAARRATNDAYGEALGLVDDAARNAGMEAATHDLEVAQKLREVSKAALADPATPRGATKAIDDVISELENRAKPMDMRTLDELRRRIAGQVRYQPGVAMPAGAKEVGAQAVQAVRGHVLDMASQLGGGVTDESLGGAVKGLLEHSADITPMAKIAAKRTTQLMGQSPVHLSGRLGIAAGASTLLAGHPGGLALIAAGFAAKGLEQRGNALAGTALNKLAKAAANPASAAKLGKYASYVLAASQRGPGALAAAHYTASQLDPQYAAGARAVMNEPTPEESGPDEVLPGAPSLKTAIPVQEP